MPTSGLSLATTYFRSLPVGLERVWENVYDWEHLPWQHGGSFLDIALEDEGTWGWRARIGLHPAEARSEIRLELVAERAEGRYVSRTIAGNGAGNEIWTYLEPVDEDHTDIRVEFWVAKLDPARIDSLARALVGLYTRLWDEDVAMMVRRDRALRERSPAPESTAPVLLGPVAALRAALPCTVETPAGPFRILEVGGSLRAHAAVCPHRLGPLEGADVVEGRVVCPWHGYGFDLESGRCDRARLRLAVPRVCVDAAGDATLRI